MSKATANPSNQAPAVVAQNPAVLDSGWKPMAHESPDESVRSFFLAAGMHLALFGLFYVGFAQGHVQKNDTTAGVPQEVVMIVDLPKTRVQGNSVTPPTRQPIEKPQPKPQPVDDVTDQKPVLPTPKPVDELAQEIQPEPDPQREEDARIQRELDELIRQQMEAANEAERKKEELARIRQANQQDDLENLAAAIGEEDSQLRGDSLDQSLLASYQSLIKARIEDAWIRPPESPKNIVCRLHVRQIIGGEVIGVSIESPCNADEATRRTILEAPKLASPLPYDGFDSVFAPDLYITFAPKQ